MVKFKSESGYSLLEMIITIGLIAIAISLSGFGLSVIFNSNVNSKANEFASELRLTASKELAASQKNYEAILKYDGTDDHYYLDVTVRNDGEVNKPVIKTINFSKTIAITKDGTPVKDISDINVTNRTFAFDQSSGGLISGGAGTYTFSATTSDITRDVVVTQVNGRVYVDE